METTDIEALVGELEQILSGMEANGFIKRVGEGYIITNEGVCEWLKTQAKSPDTINPTS